MQKDLISAYTDAGSDDEAHELLERAQSIKSKQDKRDQLSRQKRPAGETRALVHANGQSGILYNGQSEIPYNGESEILYNATSEILDIQVDTPNSDIHKATSDTPDNPEALQKARGEGEEEEREEGLGGEMEEGKMEVEVHADAHTRANIGNMGERLDCKTGPLARTDKRDAVAKQERRAQMQSSVTTSVTRSVGEKLDQVLEAFHRSASVCIGLFCSLVALFSRSAGLVCSLVGLFCSLVGLFCSFIGLFGSLAGLFC